MADDTEEWLAQRQKQPQGAAVIAQVQDQKPDAVARGVSLGEALNQAPSLEDAVNTLREQTVALRASQAAMKGAPNTEAWFADHQNAAVAHDDVDRLSWWERGLPLLAPVADLAKSAFPGLSLLPGAAKAGGTVGGAYADDPTLITRDAASVPAALNAGFGDIDFFKLSSAVALGTATSEQRAEFVRQQAARQRVAKSGVNVTPGPLSVAARTAPQLLEGVAQGRNEIVLGAGLGAAVGAEAFGVGAVPGAAAGAGIGLRVGYSKASFIANTGAAYEEFSAIRDEQGKPLDPDVARVAAILAGGGSAALDVIGFDKLAELGGSSMFTRPALAQLLMRPTVREGLKKIAVKYGEAVGTEALTETLQEGLTVLGGELAKKADGSDFAALDLPATGERLKDAAVQGAQAAAVLGGIVTTPNIVSEVGRAREANLRAAFFDAMADNADNSKLKGRMPERYEKAIEQISRGGPVESVYVDAEAFNELFQSKGADAKEAMAAMGLDPADLSRAMTEGGDIAIPISTWAAKVAGTETDAGLRDHIKLRPDDMTLAQAREYEANEPELVATAREAQGEADKAGEARDAETKALYDQAAANLSATGVMSDREVDANATLLTEAYRTLAARAGLPLNTFLEQFPVPTVVGHVAGRNTGRPAPATIAPIIQQAAEAGGVSASYLTALARRESSFDPEAVASSSSAAGLYQFTDRTWVKTLAGSGTPEQQAVAKAITFDRNGRAVTTTQEQRDLMNSRLDAGAASAAVVALTKANGKTLRNALGREATDGELYAAHFLGPAGAKKLLTAEAGANAAELFPQAAKANKRIFFDGERARTVSEVRENLGKGFEGGQALAQMAGVGALTAPREAFNQAVALERAGELPGVIEDQTGWRRGDDKAWRFEITDHEAGFTENAPERLDQILSATGRGAVRLASVLEHPALYEAYPQLADMNVSALPPMSRSRAAFHPDGGISLNAERVAQMVDGKATDQQKEELISSLLHEVQHAIQMIEGHAVGASPQADWLRKLGYGEALDARVDEMMAKGYDGDRDQAEVSAAYEVYKRSAGEIEARNTQARRAMTPQGRADLPGDFTRDVPRSEAVVSLKWGAMTSEVPLAQDDIATDDGVVRRGSIEGVLPIRAGRAAIINLFEARDTSTFAHESGHLFLAILDALSRGSAATDQMKADMATLRDWWGIGAADPIGVREHEMFAEGFEQYLYEGRAPSVRLQSVFETFRSWLVFVYRKLRGVRADVSNPVREVMDRLLATDIDIAEARSGQNFEPLFTDPEADGLTPDQAAVYHELRARAVAQAHAEADRRVLAAVKRQEKAWWKAEREGVHDATDREVAKRPAYRAFEWLAHERWLYGDAPADLVPMKLSKADIVEDYGEITIKGLTRGFGRVYADEGGVHPDIAAQAFGFQSGGELLAAMSGMEKRSVVTDRETNMIMTERYGDPMADGTIPALAMEASHNASQQRMIELELQGLQGRPVRKGMAEAARREVAERKVGDLLKPERHLAAERKAARLAQDAYAAGDKEEAARQKYRQLAAYHTWVATRNAAEEIEQVRTYVRKFDRDGVRKNLAGDYIEQIDALLAQFDFKQATQRAIGKRESLAAFAARMEAEGLPTNIDPRLLDQAQKEHYTKLTMSELRGLRDSVKSIEKLGRLKKELLDNGKRRDKEKLIQEFLDQTWDLRPFSKPSNRLNEPKSLPSMADLATKDGWDRFLRVSEMRARGIDAALWKVESMADVLDKGDINGVAHRVLIRPAIDAANKEGLLHERVGAVLREKYEAVPKDQRKRWDARSFYPELKNKETGTAFDMTRGELVSIALNVGNASNMDKLAEGYGWTPDDIMAVLTRTLTNEEWGFVQGVWDTLETLWPDIAAAEKVLTGSEPERIEPVAFETPAGTLRGGYYPVVYDPNRSLRARENADKAAADMFNGIFFVANTPSGHTKARTNFTGPLLLSVEGVLFGHINKVIKRASYGEFAISARSFINDETVAKIITTKLGAEYYSQLMPWLQRQINDRLAPDVGIGWWEKFAKQARMNFQMVAMGFRATTGLAQLAGLAASADVIGAQWIARGVMETARLNVGSQEFVFGRSEEMRQRMGNIDRDLRDAMRELSGKDGVLDDIRRAAFMHIGFTDVYVVAMPTWLGGYYKALNEGMMEEDAIAVADKAVRQSQGSGRAKDLAAVQDPHSEYMKLFTLFYSYFNVQYQRQRALTRALSEGDFAKAFNTAFWLLAVAPIAGSLLTGDWPEDKDDPEAWLQWAMRKVFFNAWQGVPVVRDIASAAENKIAGKFSSYSATPMTRAGDSFFTLGKDIYRSTPFSDKEPSDRWLKHAIETPGYALGLPTGQVSNTAQYLWDLMDGDQRPENIGEFLTGLAKGPQKGQAD